MWVKCDDGVWWPAKIAPVEELTVRDVEPSKDSCVEFFHHCGTYYTVLSTDPARVQRLHASPVERSAQERLFFSNPAVQEALRRVLPASPASPSLEQLPPLLSSSSGSSGAGGGQCSANSSTDFSASDRRCINQLLEVIDPALAARHFSVARAAPQRSSRKRGREYSYTPDGATARDAIALSRSLLTASFEGDAEDTRQSSKPPEYYFRQSSTSSGSPPSVKVPETDAGAVVDSNPSQHTSLFSSMQELNEIPFSAPVKESVMKKIQEKVFRNTKLFVLSPIFEYIDILGAVEVTSQSLKTNFSLPPSFCATEERILLVPLDCESYSHQSGWMIAINMDGVTYEMQLVVNGKLLPSLVNWGIPACMESRAVKTSPAVDVTAAVLDADADPCFSRESISLEVRFPAVLDEDVVLWNGIIACLRVRRIPVSTLEQRILRRCCPISSIGATADTAQEGQHRHEGTEPRGEEGEETPIRVLEGTFSAKCPLTFAPMTLPVRGLHCEHLQCMELSAVLLGFTRSNIWNCPICGQSLRPNEIRLDPELRDWIHQHPHQINDVDFFTRREGGPLIPHYITTKRTTPPICIID